MPPFSVVSADDEKKPKKEYAFEGSVIRLIPKDFDDWKKAFPNLNLYAELVSRDEWLSTQPENIQKSWFPSTAVYFSKKNRDGPPTEPVPVGGSDAVKAVFAAYERLGI